LHSQTRGKGLSGRGREQGIGVGKEKKSWQEKLIKKKLKINLAEIKKVSTFAVRKKKGVFEKGVERRVK